MNPSMMQQPVSVVLPALNEERAIGGVIDEVKSVLTGHDIRHEVLVVDDGSTDRTAEVARSHGARVISHPQNLGYGRSLKDGIHAARHELIAMLDADGTYPPGRVLDLLQYADRFHMVVGQRIGREYHRSWATWMARMIFQFLAEFATGRHIPDVNSGYRVLRRSHVLHFFPHISSGFSFTTTITLVYLLHGMTVHYLPIQYEKRIGKSKVRPFRDSLRALQIIVEAVLRFNPIKAFLLLAIPPVGFAALLLVWAAVGLSATALLLATVFLCTAMMIVALGFLAVALAPARRDALPLRTLLAGNEGAAEREEHPTEDEAARAVDS